MGYVLIIFGVGEKKEIIKYLLMVEKLLNLEMLEEYSLFDLEKGKKVLFIKDCWVY